MPDTIQHIAWSISGDRIGTACKDKRARFFDPRAPGAVGEFSPHQGTKQAKFVWLNGSKCMTVGFGKQAQREIKVWDTRCVKALPSLYCFNALERFPLCTFCNALEGTLTMR